MEKLVARSRKLLATLEKDWSTLAPDRQIAILKQMKPEALCAFVRRIDPSVAEVSVIRWVVAQKTIDLGTALTIFFGLEPRRLNLIPRNAVKDERRDLCALLDVICQRINCGFYLPVSSRQMDNPEFVSAWLLRQKSDIKVGRRGRWILDAAIVAPMASEIRLKGRRKKTPDARPSIFQSFFTPLFVPSR